MSENKSEKISENMLKDTSKDMSEQNVGKNAR